jgi:hypothetical protein
LTTNNTQQRMYQMSEAGELKNVARGLYTLNIDIDKDSKDNKDNKQSKDRKDEDGVNLTFLTNLMGVLTEKEGSSKVAGELLAVVRGWVDRPPSWLKRSVENFRRQPDRYGEPLASAITAEVYGSPQRWREVLQFLAPLGEAGD